MIINIVGAGPDELVPNLQTFNEENVVWVGVDRGVYTLIQNKIESTTAFGDFDSVTSEQLHEIESTVQQLKKFKPEKDETDMELALIWALGQNPMLIRIFGATGGRLDHFYANASLLIKPLIEANETQIEIIDKFNTLFVKGPGQYTLKKDTAKKYISFVPLALTVQGLTLKGFKYPLNDRNIPLGSTLCISNELINDYGTFSFHEGILLVVRSRDAERGS